MFKTAYRRTLSLYEVSRVEHGESEIGYARIVLVRVFSTDPHEVLGLTLCRQQAEEAGGKYPAREVTLNRRYVHM